MVVLKTDLDREREIETHSHLNNDAELKQKVIVAHLCHLFLL